jgi:hypothetical protein
VNDAVDAFYDVLYDAFDRSFPTNNEDFRLGFPKWFSCKLIHDMRKKHLFHKLWKQTKSTIAYDRFRILRKSVKEQINFEYKRYVEGCEENIKLDPSRFWNYVKDKKSNNSVPTTMKLYGSSYSNPHDIANGFAEYFASVFGQPSDPVTKSYVNDCRSIIVDGISEEEIICSIKKLKPKRSFGPDLVPSYIFKEMGLQLIYILQYIFNLSIGSGIFPDKWKVTKVTPIHKKGDVFDMQNYRPVAVVSTPAKLLESIIHKRLWNECSNFLIDQQHGFRPSRSTVTNLINFQSYIGKCLDDKIQVDVNYNDFEKAFDRVDHSLLIEKLKRLDLSRYLIVYIISYLENRHQYVSYHDCMSEKYQTPSGVPQGSNLGPLLFLIFVNDIKEVIKYSECLLYADDLKVFRKIESRNDAEMLQMDVDSLVVWSNENKLAFNVPKCSIMTYTRSHNPIRHQYTMNTLDLNRVTEMKDLGVTFQDDMTFRKHILGIESRANRMLGFVLRNASFFKCGKTLRVLYEALVRSILESGSIIWGPDDVTYSLVLEKVQKRFLRYLYRVEYGYYPYLYPSLFVMGCLNYSTLKIRRADYICRHFYKLIYGIVHNPSLLSDINLFVPDSYGRTRSHILFYPPRGRTNIIYVLPASRAVRYFNVLATHLDIFNVTYTEFTEYVGLLAHLLV